MIIGLKTGRSGFGQTNLISANFNITKLKKKNCLHDLDVYFLVMVMSVSFIRYSCTSCTASASSFKL